MLILWSQRDVINQELKKMLQNCSIDMRGVQKFKEPMKRMPHETTEAQRTINEMFLKKENANTSLYIF